MLSTHLNLYNSIFVVECYVAIYQCTLYNGNEWSHMFWNENDIDKNIEDHQKYKVIQQLLILGNFSHYLN